MCEKMTIFGTKYFSQFLSIHLNEIFTKWLFKNVSKKHFLIVDYVIFFSYLKCNQPLKILKFPVHPSTLKSLFCSSLMNNSIL